MRQVRFWGWLVHCIAFQIIIAPGATWAFLVAVQEVNRLPIKETTKSKREELRRQGLCIKCKAPAMRDTKSYDNKTRSYCKACHVKRYGKIDKRSKTKVSRAEQRSRKSSGKCIRCGAPVKKGLRPTENKPYLVCENHITGGAIRRNTASIQHDSYGKYVDEYDYDGPITGLAEVTDGELQSLRREMKSIWDELGIEWRSHHVPELTFKEVNFWGEHGSK